MIERAKPLILILTDFYLPGFKSGGGLRTLVNTVERLGDDYDFRVICRDHDGKTDKTPYQNVKINDWNQIGKAKVYFLSPNNIKIGRLKHLIEEIKPDSVYANSCFSTLSILFLTLRKLRKFKKIPVIIAPEGELSEGAIKLKRFKKSLFTKAAGIANLYTDIVWKTVAAPEYSEVEKFKGKGGKIFIAPNMPPKEIFPDFQVNLKPKKIPGEISLIYLSRIHPKKNLKYLINLLENVKHKVILDVYGPDDNHQYYSESLSKASQLPENINVNFKGEVKYEEAVLRMAEYHFFVLPTLGENFGHVFVEAFSAGSPVITSDKTPWRNLSKDSIGWDISLSQTDEWLNVLDFCARLNNKDFLEMSVKCREFALNWLKNPSVERATREVIDYSLKST